MPAVMEQRRGQKQQIEGALAEMFSEARDQCRSDHALLFLQMRKQLRTALEEVNLLKEENRWLRTAAATAAEDAAGRQASGRSDTPSVTALDERALEEEDQRRMERARTVAEEPCRGLLGRWIDRDNPGLIQELEESKISSSTGEEFPIVELSNTKVWFLDFQKNVLKGELVGNLLVWNDGGVWCRDLFEKMDADHDGILTEAEVRQAWEDMLAFVSSQTGTVSPDQFELYCQVPVPGLFARMDPNGAGALTQEKFEAFFKGLSTGGDGVLREDFQRVQVPADSCECGNFFKADDAYCRWCGKEQPGNIRCDGAVGRGRRCDIVLTKYTLQCPECAKVFRRPPPMR